MASLVREWEITPASDIAESWLAIEPFIKRACIKSLHKYKPADFLQILIDGKAQLWLGTRDGIIEAAAITDVVQYPQKKYARVTVGMGEGADEIQEFIDAFESWARSLDCDGVQSHMRPGFEPQFRKSNWKKTHVLMEKDFNNA